MNERRRFMKFAAAAAFPAMLAEVARADDSDDQDIRGAWQTVHSLPFPPGSFREFLTFGSEGTVHETNSFLHTASNLDFSMFGLPNVLNASDGVGNWRRAGRGAIQVVFRKMLFDGSRRNFGDLKATGIVRVNGSRLRAEWFVSVVDLQDRVIAPLGPATSEGIRLA